MYPKSNGEDDIGSSFFEEPNYNEFQIVVNSPKIPSEEDIIMDYEKIEEEGFWNIFQLLLFRIFEWFL